ncbi:MAG: YchF/TatD family DNA exonuclease [Bacteroidetes bacterium]|jgi:TatD DNase family protein|nr:YchF/TatD family DNA exonuclease [Bacteroidota bacterium]
MFVDTHTHLYLQQFDTDRDHVMEAAQHAGIGKMFLPGIDSTYTNRMLALCNEYPELCYPMIGLHPTSVKNGWQKEMDHVHETLNNHTFYGIGETGIDLYWDKSTLEDQKMAFREQIQLAMDNQLPLIIHARDSFNEILEVLEQENSDKLFGIFHCFTGNYEQANRILELKGFKLGIGGVVTFKNAGLDKVVSRLDLANIVLETDSPYLAPAPFRGKRNETAYLVKVAEKLSDIYGLPIEDIENVTTRNALNLFKV